MRTINKPVKQTASEPPLLEATARGLDCAAGGFTIDPYRTTDISVITHAHADHARRVPNTYYAANSSVPLLKKRLGDDINNCRLEFGETITLGETQVSLHPAGYVLGAAQVRVEHEGDVWVFTGDFKRDHDPSCEAFEPVPCNTLITEATFALPVYRWQSGTEIAAGSCSVVAIDVAGQPPCCVVLLFTR